MNWLRIPIICTSLTIINQGFMCSSPQLGTRVVPLVQLKYLRHGETLHILPKSCFSNPHHPLYLRHISHTRFHLNLGDPFELHSKQDTCPLLTPPILSSHESPHLKIYKIDAIQDILRYILMYCYLCCHYDHLTFCSIQFKCLNLITITWCINETWMRIYYTLSLCLFCMF